MRFVIRLSHPPWQNELKAEMFSSLLLNKGGIIYNKNNIKKERKDI